LEAFPITNMWQVYTRPTGASDFFFKYALKLPRALLAHQVYLPLILNVAAYLRNVDSSGRG
jgi:hypothetical protein